MAKYKGLEQDFKQRQILAHPLVSENNSQLLVELSHTRISSTEHDVAMTGVLQLVQFRLYIILCYSYKELNNLSYLLLNYSPTHLKTLLPTHLHGYVYKLTYLLSPPTKLEGNSVIYRLII